MTDFEEIYRQHQLFIYRYLLSLSRNADIAEELTQETFFRAYMNLPKLRQEGCIAVWLCQIAKNAYFAWYHLQKRDLPLESAQTLASPEHLEDRWIQKELSHAALQALDCLDAPYKQVLILAIFAEMPLRQISQLYGKSESWARVTFHRGKQKLLERMKENGT